MSRRAPAAPDRTEQNRAALKQLVKLEGNKSCVDCKRNKHPRWASWNIGVFLCIRCSGIHRGMGTHISRVKSVDLDSWTDEQMQNMLRWGNTRANKYWEHKLADGHVPNEAKIENFIRTKYDSKRWAMDGPIPDPATLDNGAAEDDDVPLNVVREKAIERSGSLRNGGVQPPPGRARPQQVDLFADAEEQMTAPPARPSTTEPVRTPGGTTTKAPAAPPKQTKPGESLLGIDFFGGASAAAPARPSSTGPTTPGVGGRADLKSSILSLYASKPTAPVQPQQQQPAVQQSNMDAFAGMQSSSTTQPSSFGGLNDAFGGLSFTPSQPQQNLSQPSTFSTATSPPISSTQARQPTTKPGGILSGGSFFDSKPAAPAPSKQTSPPIQPTITRTESIGSTGFGDFSSSSPPTNTTIASSIKPAAATTATTSSMTDLFDLSPSPPSQPTAAPIKPAAPVQGKQPPPINYSAFNLSQPAPQSSPPKPAAQTAATAPLSNFSTLNMDPWGSNDAWATPDPPSQPSQPAMQVNTASTSTFKSATTSMQTPAMQTPFDSGWGDVASSSSPPKPAGISTTSGGFGGGFNSTSTTGGGSGGFTVQQDDDFGGWSHASPVAASPHASKPSGSGGGGGFAGTTDDLFGNVWG